MSGHPTKSSDLMFQNIEIENPATNSLIDLTLSVIDNDADTYKNEDLTDFKIHA